MIRRSKKHTRKGKRFLSMLCLTSFTLTSLIIPKNVTKVKALSNVPYEEKKSLQPLGNIYSIKSLLDWVPESDPDDRYNKSTIKMHDRFTGEVVNSNANPNAKVMNLAITNANCDDAPSQGSDSQDSYIFSYWQYLDSYVYWGGSERGIFCIPTPDIIDGAHKNGVPVLATVGFPWGRGKGYVEQVREFIQKDKNGNFPVADKMIELAKFYGFDGYFINQESYGCNKNDADLMIEMFSYMKEKAPDIRLAWYDSMSVQGPVKYQDSLTDLNSGFLQNGNKRVMDEFFLNYNWNKRKIDTTVKTAKKIGRNPFDVFAGLDVQQNAYNTKFQVDSLLDKDNKLRVSLAMYCPNSTFSMAKDIEDFYNQDQKFWIGSTKDPSKTNTKKKWVGLANYIADKSAITELPFVTNFNLGHGQKYYVNGNLARKKGWNNRSIQDYLPTWRWIVESNGSKLKPNFDFEDAYNGGNSLKIEGKLQANNPNHIKLYSTNLDIKNDTTEISIMYKAAESDPNMKIGLCFGDNYDKSNFQFFDVKNGTVGEWTKSTISLKDYKGKKISAISLKFESKEDIENYKINIGNISIKDEKIDKTLPPTSKVTLDEVMFHNASNAEVRMYWNKMNDESLSFYEIYRVKPNGEKEFVGSTPNNAYYISPFDRYNNEDKFDFEIVPVDKNYKRGKENSVTFNWQLPIGATEIPNNKIPENLALNKPVKVNGQNSGEPAMKAVDGKVENNSKWCYSNAMSGYLDVDLGEVKTIQRWVVKHGEAGGEAKDTNTKDFDLQVSRDGGKTYEDVDKVDGNAEAITDRNLSEPVTGQYFRLKIRHSGNSPWRAIRIYEFQLFEKPYIPTTENIPMHFVKSINNVGNKDEITFTNVPEQCTVMLYKNIKDNEPFAIKKCNKEDNGVIKFSNLDFGEKEGRIYYATKEENKGRSIKLSVPYNNENWKLAEIPNKFTISEYNTLKENSDLYYGKLEVGDLNPGDVVNFYANKNDLLPTKVSVPVQEGENSAKIERLVFNKQGGEMILEIKRQGTKGTDKFVLKYKDTKEASTKGQIKIKVDVINLDGNKEMASGVSYDVIKEGKIVGNIITDESGIGISKPLDPGKYTIKYNCELDEYVPDNKEYEIEITKPFDYKVGNITIKKQKLGSATIKAIDSKDNKKGISGAIFEILDNEGKNILKEVVTNENGLAKVLLKPGKYKVRQKETEVGYLKNSHTFELTIEEGLNKTNIIEIKNEAKENNYQVIIPVKPNNDNKQGKDYSKEEQLEKDKQIKKQNYNKTQSIKNKQKSKDNLNNDGKLVQTGSPIGFTQMVILGTILIIAGIAVQKKGIKKIQ